mmetsp:Transcript_42977/g.100115  ORF Transcript_42977/g.100115 Transcript_42977/m.100115 type:complete len:243 (-) Transcript_42977:56-784(-)
MVGPRENVWRQPGLLALHLVASSNCGEFAPNLWLQRHDARPLRCVKAPSQTLAPRVLATNEIMPTITVIPRPWPLVDIGRPRLQGLDHPHAKDARRVSRHQLLNAHSIVRVFEHKAGVQELVPHFHTKALEDCESLLATTQFVLHLHEITWPDGRHGKRSLASHLLYLLHVELVHDVPAPLGRHRVADLVQWRPLLSNNGAVHGANLFTRARWASTFSQPSARNGATSILRPTRNAAQAGAA